MLRFWLCKLAALDTCQETPHQTRDIDMFVGETNGEQICEYGKTDRLFQ